MKVRLIFTTASRKRRTLTRTLPLVIGRSGTADLKLPETCEHVSRRHCEVFCDAEGSVCVRDLHSTNGTFIAGRQLPPETIAPVTSGAGIKLGDISFRVEYPVVSAAAEATPARDAGAADEELEAGATADAPLPVTEPLDAHQPPEERSPRALDRPAADPDAAAADEGDFGFLADAEHPAAADDKLDDFFKGLS